MTDQNFLRFLAARLVNVYGESPNVDFVQRLHAMAERQLPSAVTGWGFDLEDRQIWVPLDDRRNSLGT